MEQWRDKAVAAWLSYVGGYIVVHASTGFWARCAGSH